MDNLEKMEKFLEMYNFPRLNQEEIENMNRTITRNEVESVILKLPSNKSAESDGLRVEFYQIFKEASTPNLLKLLPKS